MSANTKVHVQEIPEIAVELAEILAALGVDPATGWKRRLKPDYADRPRPAVSHKLRDQALR
jgi:hypothetical protein